MWKKDKKMQEEINMASSISVFAAGLKVEGDVEAINDIRIDGVVLGNISSNKKVMIGGTGKVKGNIHANEVFIMGEIYGDLHISGLANIGSTGKVRGSIVSANIQIEPGADVEGTLKKIGVVKNESRDNSSGRVKEIDTNHPFVPSHLHKAK